MARPKEKKELNYNREDIDEESSYKKPLHKIKSPQKHSTDVLKKRAPREHFGTKHTQPEIDEESSYTKPSRKAKSAPPLIRADVLPKTAPRKQFGSIHKQEDIDEESRYTKPSRKVKSAPPQSLRNKYGTILIMNAGSPSGKIGDNPKDRKKQTIHDVIEHFSPGIALFQEFTWKTTSGKVWGSHSLPDRFVLSGHEHASLLIDRERYEFESIQANVIEQLISRTQTQLKDTVAIDQNEFSPNARMDIKRFKKKDSKREIILISWHGRSNQKSGGSLANDKKRNLFKYLFEFLCQLRKKFKLPMVIGGDFNIAIGEIESFVKTPFQLIECEASARRNKVIDYIIATTDLSVSGVRYIDLDNVTKATDPNQVLDHDPIFAHIEFE